MKIESRNEGKLTHVEVSGRIDASTSASVDTASDAALESAGQSVIFDLREVSYVSSAGLRAFVRAAKKAKAGGGGIAIFGLQANVAEIFAAAGFDRIIPIAATEAQAREKLGA